MIIDKLIQKIANGNEDIAAGLAAVLAAVLAVGLAFGLVVGLAFGLAAGLAFGLVDLLTTTSFISTEWILLIIAIVVITELLFWLLDKQKPAKGQSVIGFTLKRKGVAFLESLYLLGNALGGMQLISKLPEAYPPLTQFFMAYGLTILEGIGVIALAVGGIAAYIWLNSLKYKKR